MSTSIKVIKTIRTVANDDELGEFELEHVPYDSSEVLTERIGDQLVVAYLVHDPEGAGNPLEESDCNGSIYLAGRNNSIWDDERQVRRELRCADGRWSGEDPDVERQFTLANGVRTTLWELAAKDVLAGIKHDYGEMQDYVDHLGYECDEGETYIEAFTSLEPKVWADLLDVNGLHSEAVEKRAFELYGEHWPRLAGPFVVPISYTDHGETQLAVDDWDGDPSDLPGGVWVADEGCITNLIYDYRKDFLVQTGSERATKAYTRKDRTTVTYVVDVPILNLVRDEVLYAEGLRGESAWATAFMCHFGHEFFDEIAKKSRFYAEGVLSEVSAWASGDIYGCVVKVFTRTKGDDPTWEQVESDSCWAFIGYEYAKETLQGEFFAPTVARIKGGV